MLSEAIQIRGLLTEDILSLNFHFSAGFLFVQLTQKTILVHFRNKPSSKKCIESHFLIHDQMNNVLGVRIRVFSKIVYFIGRA